MNLHRQSAPPPETTRLGEPKLAKLQTSEQPAIGDVICCEGEKMITRDSIGKKVSKIFMGTDYHEELVFEINTAVADEGNQSAEVEAAILDKMSPTAYLPDYGAGLSEKSTFEVVDGQGGQMSSENGNKHGYWATTLLSACLANERTETMDDTNIYTLEPEQNFEEMCTTIISKDTSLEGEVVSNGHLEVYGDLNGNVRAKGNVRICGKVVGDISGNNIELVSCAVKGNINAKAGVNINDESMLIGNVEASDLMLDGRLKGDVSLRETIFFMQNAVLLGKVKATTISIKEGAKLYGEIQIEHGNDDNLFREI
jgi:cytoskeletal protein CcmA (bactofilin family)